MYFDTQTAFNIEASAIWSSWLVPDLKHE